MAKARKRSVRRARRKANPGTVTTPPTSTDQQQANLAPLTSALQGIAKSFAVIALRLAEGRLGQTDGSRSKNVGPRAKFLQALGMEAKDIGPVLGSTERSVTVLLSRARRGRRGGRRKPRSRPSER